MTEEKNKLTVRQRQALVALAGGASQSKAARQVGVADRTMRRWLADPDFAEALDRAFTDQLHQAGRALCSAATDAAHTLADLCDPSQPPHVRCSAAVAILRAARESAELADIDKRLTELERRRTAGAFR